MYWAALRYVLFLFGFIYWAALNNNKELINAKGITAIVNWFYILFYFVRSIAGLNYIYFVVLPRIHLLVLLIISYL